MLSNDEINNIYSQYINDLNIKHEMPTIIPRPKPDMEYLAQAKQITPDLFEIALGKKFCYQQLSKKYIIPILYHEFTHIYDQTIFLTNIRDKQQKTNLLYPYTEYHASQIQITKQLELFHNPDKKVNKSTTIYDENGFITLSEFNKIEKEQFDLRLQYTKQNQSKHDFHLLMYHIVYNIGYYSIYKKYDLFRDTFIFNLPFNYIQNDINDLIEKLIDSNPSDDLCYETNTLINQITLSICKKELL